MEVSGGQDLNQNIEPYFNGDSEFVRRPSIIE